MCKRHKIANGRNCSQWSRCTGKFHRGEHIVASEFILVSVHWSYRFVIWEKKQPRKAVWILRCECQAQCCWSVMANCIFQWEFRHTCSCTPRFLSPPTGKAHFFRLGIFSHQHVKARRNRKKFEKDKKKKRKRKGHTSDFVTMIFARLDFFEQRGKGSNIVRERDPTETDVCGLCLRRRPTIYGFLIGLIFCLPSYAGPPDQLW